MNSVQSDGLQKVDEALQGLESNFLNFQKRYEEKMQKMLLAPYRPNFEKSLDSGNKADFVSYAKSGKKALTSSDDNSGSYLIPSMIVDRIQSGLRQTPCMRSLAKITTITNDYLEVLLDKENGEAGWVSEVSERLDTESPELNRLQISVHEMYAKPRVSQKLLDDSHVDIEQWLSQKIADKFSVMENLAFIQGDGEGKPKGFLSYPKTSFGTGSWGKIEEIATGVDGGLSDADILLKTVGSLKAQYLTGAVWLISRGALTSIRCLKDGITGRHLWQPILTGEHSATLLGFPVVVSDDMPSMIPGQVSTSIAFGNFYYGYQIVDRSDMHILRDPFSAKPYVEFYTTKRVGGDVVDFDAIKVISCRKE